MDEHGQMCIRDSGKVGRGIALHALRRKMNVIVADVEKKTLASASFVPATDRDCLLYTSPRLHLYCAGVRMPVSQGIRFKTGAVALLQSAQAVIPLEKQIGGYLSGVLVGPAGPLLHRCV